jgi:hypothetical protein
VQRVLEYVYYSWVLSGLPALVALDSVFELRGWSLHMDWYESEGKKRRSVHLRKIDFSLRSNDTTR